MNRKNFLLESISSYSRVPCLYFVVAALLTLQLTTSLVSASPASHPTLPIVGGSRFNPLGSPVASIRAFADARAFQCSGILVGSHTVLTAGHCISQDVPVESYLVWISGSFYSVVAAAHSPYYNPTGDINENAKYDFGLLILAENVTSVQPAPILFGGSIESGMQLRSFGFGLNENPDYRDLPIELQAKVAKITVTAVRDGTFEGSLEVSDGITCSGDSGGPVVQTIDKYRVLVGSLSLGTTRGINNICISTGPSDTSTWVDLQSQTSQNALRQIADIQFISADLIKFSLKIATLKNLMARTNPPQTYQQLAKITGNINKSIKPLRLLADAKRLKILKKLSTATLAFSQSTTTTDAKRGLSIIKKLVNQLASLNAD